MVEATIVIAHGAVVGVPRPCQRIPAQEADLGPLAGLGIVEEYHIQHGFVGRRAG